MISEMISVLDAIQEPVGLIDRNFRYIRVNKALAMAVSSDTEDLVDKACFEVWEERNEPCDDCPLLRVYATGRNEIGLRVANDGRVFEVQASPILDASGNVSEVIELTRDITTQLVNENRIEVLHWYAAEMATAETIEEIASRTLLATRQVLDYEAASFIAIDGNIPRMIDFDGEYYGLKKDIPMSDGIVLKVARTGEYQIVEDASCLLDTQQNDGRVLSPAHELAVPVKIHDEIIGAIAVESRKKKFSDEDGKLLETIAVHVASSINTIRHKEELERSNRALDDYTHVVSHDLKAPLRSISAFSSFLLDGYLDILDETGQDYLMRIENASKRMSTLIDDLLLLSRVGRKHTESEFVDLNSLVEGITDDFEAQLIERGAQIQIGELPKIETQRVWVRQLFANLIGNGLKFNRSPAPKVEVRCEEREHDYLFSVNDNGIGIKEEDKQHLFKLFQRLHTQEEFPGTGAGLTICKKIVEGIGGEIWVESRPGSGTTFYFTYPKKQVEYADALMSQRSEPVPVTELTETGDMVHSSRGISSIIANLLLVAIVVSAGTMLVVWTNTSVDDFREDIGGWLVARSEETMESIMVEEVWFQQNATGRYLVLYIRNYGVIDLNVSSIYVNGTPAWNGSMSISLKNVVSTTLDYSWTSGLVEITVSTTRGRTSESYWVPPVT